MYACMYADACTCVYVYVCVVGWVEKHAHTSAPQHLSEDALVTQHTKP